MEISGTNVFLLGDVHGMWERLDSLLPLLPEDAIILQLGDFGFDPRHNFVQFRPEFGLFGIWPPRIKMGNKKLFWLPGNHEDHDALPNEIKEVAPSITYLPPGTVFSINGKKVLAIGGADTVSWDRMHRTIGKTIFPEKEGVQKEIVDGLLKTISPKEIHIFLSHAAPRQFVIPNIVPDTYEDSRNNLAELLVLCPNHWFFGHYHLSHENASWVNSQENIHVCRWRAVDVLEFVDISTYF